jgi:NAD(P)H-dependent FMN reductase
MARVVGLSGSLRRSSYNSALLRAAVELAPAGFTIDVGSIRELPVYDGDLEEAAYPPAAAQLKDHIAGADGLLIVSPEYNNGVPGPLKNAIDWLTRPPGEAARVFRGLPFGLIGATPGQGGTRMAQTAWLQTLKYLDVRPFWGKAVYLSAAALAFDAEGRLVDEKMRGLVRDYMAAFADFVTASRRTRQ